MQIQKINPAVENKRNVKLRKRRTISKTCKTYLPVLDISSYRKQLRAISKMSCIVSLTVLFLTGVENELYYRNGNTLNLPLNMARFGIILLSLLQLPLTILYFHKKLEVKKAYKEVSSITILYQDSKILKSLVLEVLIICLCTPPFVSHIVDVHHSATLTVDDIFYLLSFSKLYFLLKYLHEISEIQSERAKMYCYLFNTKTGMSFSLKYCVKKYPFMSISAISVSFFFAIVIMIRVSERNSNSFNSVWDALWIIGTTQTTIGYGDFIPVSDLGRLICFFTAVFGQFLFYFAFITLIHKIFLSKEESKVYFDILYNKHKLINPAAEFIKQWMIAKRKHRGSLRTVITKIAFSRSIVFSGNNCHPHKQVSDVYWSTSKAISNSDLLLEGAYEVEKKGDALVRGQHFMLQKIACLKRDLKLSMLRKTERCPTESPRSAHSPERKRRRDQTDCYPQLGRGSYF